MILSAINGNSRQVFCNPLSECFKVLLSFEKKLELISLICLVTYKTKQKNPDATHYYVLNKLSDKLGLPEDFIKGLSIVCEDFGYHCTDFPSFGLKGQDIVKEIRGILNTYLPF